MYGPNPITVTASVINGRTGSDTITITRLVDVTAPTVVSVDPPNGASGLAGTVGIVRITFSEPVSYDTGDVSLRLADTGAIVAVSPANQGSTTAQLDFAAQRGARYEVRATNVKDLGGNLLSGGTFLSTFSVAP